MIIVQHSVKIATQCHKLPIKICTSLYFHPQLYHAKGFSNSSFPQVAEVKDTDMAAELKETASENAQPEGTPGTEAAW